MDVHRWLYTFFFPGVDLLKGCLGQYPSVPSAVTTAWHRHPFACGWWVPEELPSTPYFPHSIHSPRYRHESLLTAHVHLTTWAADHYQNRLAHPGIIKQHLKSPCLGKEVLRSETHQTQGLAHHAGSKQWLSSSPADQSDPAATWNTAKDKTSLASSSQPVLYLHSTWHGLASCLEPLSTYDPSDSYAP